MTSAEWLVPWRGWQGKLWFWFHGRVAPVFPNVKNSPCPLLGASERDEGGIGEWESRLRTVDWELGSVGWNRFQEAAHVVLTFDRSLEQPWRSRSQGTRTELLGRALLC